jgi:hypothetical protein
MMPKGIDVPGSGWNIVECILKPAKSNSHLIDEVLVIHVGLIGHAPSSINEMKLSPSNDVPHLLPLLICGLVPPSIEEGHFHNREFILRVFVEFAHDSVDGVLHACELGAHVAAVEIIIDCLEPPDIIMGMGYDVDCHIRGIRIRGLLMVLLHHLLVLETKRTRGRNDE